jgi:hypothetical protein
MLLQTFSLLHDEFVKTNTTAKSKVNIITKIILRINWAPNVD